MTESSEGGRLPFPPLMVAVAGASGSGKSTLAAELARTLGGLHFSLDNYYRDLSHLAMEKRRQQNFDDPAMMEIGLLAEHIAALAQARTIVRPLYDFATYTRIPDETEIVRPVALVIVEGLFSTYFPELRNFYQLSVFVDTPDDVCFDRRLRRDVVERGRDPESVQRQYDATVRPCGLAFVRPLIDFADLVVEGTDALDFKVEQVISAMRKRGLMHRFGLSDRSEREEDWKNGAEAGGEYRC
jgi:uridine kinase